MCQVFVKLLVTFSISMYITCVILCLFSSVGRRVGALQISIIIIIIRLIIIFVSRKSHLRYIVGLAIDTCFRQ